MSSAEDVLLVVGFVVLGVGAVAGSLWWNHHRTQQWHEAAKKAGLGSSGSWPTVTMSGTLAGVPVQLRQWTTRHGSGKNRRTAYHVRAEAGVARDLEGVCVSQASWLDTLGAKFLGMQDLEIGDPAFDAKFVVKGDDPARARRVLDPSVRSALLETCGMLGQVGLQDNSVVFYERRATTPDRAIDVLLALSTCAVTVGGVS